MSTIIVKVPPDAGHLALLRTVIGGVAARDRFTLDQIDDLRMAVEEAAVQLLKRADGGHIKMTIAPTAEGLEVRLSAAVDGAGALIDETSFSWAILTALSDDLRVETGTAASPTVVVLTKHRLAVAAEPA